MTGEVNFESPAAILTNIAELTGVDESEVDPFIYTLADISKGELAHQTYWKAFRDRFQVNPAIERTVCFHGTRCPRTTSFAEGLLPNHQVISSLWQMMWDTCGEFVDAESAEQMRTIYEVSPDSRQAGGFYERIQGLRTRERGPWGKVIRDEWLISGRNSNHYLEAGPELVAIVLSFFSTTEDLRAVFKSRTSPCIVHFATARADPFDLGHGLAFLRDQRFCSFPHSYEHFYGIHSAEGSAVLNDSIVRIEFIEQDIKNNL
jgi:hypothetical protein